MFILIYMADAGLREKHGVGIGYPFGFGSDLFGFWVSGSKILVPFGYF